MTSRSYCGTLNFSNDEQILCESLCQPGEHTRDCLFSRFRARVTESHGNGLVRYCVLQLERGGERKRLHIQFYVELPRSHRVRGVQKLLLDTGSKRIHLERRRGRRDEARDYCRKTEDRAEGEAPHEIGAFESGGQGRRSDAQSVLSALAAGKSLSEVITSNPGYGLRYFGNIQKCRGILCPPKVRTGIRCALYWGRAGTGKSTRAHQEALKAVTALNPEGKETPYYTWNGGKWFDGYDGQLVVVCHEFTGKKHQVAIEDLLQLLDWPPLRVQNKGGFSPMFATRFYLSSNLPMEKWWAHDPPPPSQLEALKRRFSEVVHFQGAVSVYHPNTNSELI